MLKRETVYVSLGSNVDDRVAFLERAREELCRLKVVIEEASSLYETEPFGLKDQPFFLNQVLRIRTSLEPLKLLFFLKNIEGKLGRIRREKWGPREIDLDILFYNSQIIHLPDLIIPHPGLQERRFVLVPLAEIAPDFIHPERGTTIKTMLEAVTDSAVVRIYKGRDANR